jgi:hypothetical protein
MVVGVTLSQALATYFIAFFISMGFGEDAAELEDVVGLRYEICES